MKGGWRQPPSQHVTPASLRAASFLCPVSFSVFHPLGTWNHAVTSGMVFLLPLVPRGACLLSGPPLAP